MLDFYRDWAGKHPPKLFQQHPTRKTILVELLGSEEQVILIAAMCEFWDYSNHSWHKNLRKKVNLLQSQLGQKQKPGKRPHTALEDLVNELTPVLLAFGVPLGTGENSPLVQVLRLVAEISICTSGDPRDQLRRLRKASKAIEAKAQIIDPAPGHQSLPEALESLPPGLRSNIREAVARGLDSLKISPPPQ